jgi:DNA-binding GntR family transcriptional regulator
VQILSVTATVFQVLRDRILTGELEPGQRLNELALSEELSISRPPLREAFRLLERDHLAVNLPRRGTYVTDLSVRGYLELTQCREMMECFAVDLLEQCNIRSIRSARAITDKTLSLKPTRDASPREILVYISSLVEFHADLVEAAQNSMLTSMYRANGLTLTRYRYLSFLVGGPTDFPSLGHAHILQLIGEGRFLEAREELRTHIGHNREVILAALGESLPADHRRQRSFD